MKLILRVKGGLGNQLYCYAAARRLALVNNAELIIDPISGFERDHEYKRKYALSNFNISARMATPTERLVPFERIRRLFWKIRERRKSFNERKYIEQEFSDFDNRLLHKMINGTTYIDGLWQSELYFADIEEVIRSDLKIVPPKDSANLELAEIIRNRNSVAVHVRWFESASNNMTANVHLDYYKKALNLLEEKLHDPYYVVFSDNPAATQERIEFPVERAIFVAHNIGELDAYADMWLMTLCNHCVIANSTFSWWGAWLGGNRNDRVVIFPRLGKTDYSCWSWDFTGQMPNSWVPIEI